MRMTVRAEADVDRDQQPQVVGNGGEIVDRVRESGRVVEGGPTGDLVARNGDQNADDPGAAADATVPRRNARDMRPRATPGLISDCGSNSVAGSPWRPEARMAPFISACRISAP